jgi:hypothetical protein
MKLIAYGKMLDDDNKTLKDFNLKENDHVVVMVSKVLLHPSNYYIAKASYKT